MSDAQSPPNDNFAAAGPDVIEPGEGELIVNLEGFEGPLDLLLTLARDQKVDLRRISMVALVDQYLAHVAQARRLRLELAADYLVMAAWLAYLKSRLLLPEPPAGEEPSGQDMADALQWQLRRLEAMQEAGVRLMARPQLGKDIFSRGQPEGVIVVRRAVWDVKLYDLLAAYGNQVKPKDADTYQIEPMQFFSVEEAAERLGRMLGIAIDCQSMAMPSMRPSGSAACWASPSTGSRSRPSCRRALPIRRSAARQSPRPSSPACSSRRTARSSCARPNASARSSCVNVPNNGDRALHV